MQSRGRCSSRSKRAPHIVTRLLLGAALLAPARPGVCADKAVEDAAAAAYERGTAAYQRGDFATAAAEYARADELSPNPVALESALKAVLRAKNPALGMELVERAGRAGGGEGLAQLARVARERFLGQAGQLIISCPPKPACTAQIDSAPAAVGARRWYATGSHWIELTLDGKTERREITVVAGASVEVKPLSATAVEPAEPAPPVEPAPARAPGPAVSVPQRPEPAAAPAPAVPPPDTGGVSPAWFWLAAGVTVVAGGVTIASGVDTLAKHDAFLATPTDQTEADGRDAQTRTNVLIGVTGAAGVTAAVLGLFVVRWSEPAPAQAAVIAGPEGLRVDVRGRF